MDDDGRQVVGRSLDRIPIAMGLRESVPVGRRAAGALALLALLALPIARAVTARRRE